MATLTPQTKGLGESTGLETSLQLQSGCVFQNQYNIWTGKEYTEPEILTKKKVEILVERFESWDLQYARNNAELYGNDNSIPVGEGERYRRLRYFLVNLITLKKIQREGKYHNPLCEYALGNNCSCWCGEKYHGAKGMNI